MDLAGCAGDSFNRDPEETAGENEAITNGAVQQSPAGSARGGSERDVKGQL